MSEKTYPLAPNGIFLTVQGEGELAGWPMVFVRLAGCSIGCPGCDTDYSVSQRMAPRLIAQKVAEVMPPGIRWIWITGGEPTDHELAPLIAELRRLGLFVKIALATAGHRLVDRIVHDLDWISVSPHDPAQWVQYQGQELKLVPGLNGFWLKDFAPVVFSKPLAFGHMFVSPCEGRPETVAECRRWVMGHPGWKMTGQLHKQWQIP